MSLGLIEKHNYTDEEKRDISLRRAAELKNKICDYSRKKDLIATGFDLQNMISLNKEKLLAFYHATEEQWNDWRWQVAHRITDPKILTQLGKQGDGILFKAGRENFPQ